jgi:hypothetical protein
MIPGKDCDFLLKWSIALIVEVKMVVMSKPRKFFTFPEVSQSKFSSS